MNKYKIVGYILFMLASPNAFSCSCQSVMSREQSIDRSKYIFIARIVKAEILQADREPFEYIQASFEVKETFKGDISEVHFINSTIGTNCSYPIQIGDLYLIYAMSSTAYLSVCGMSKWLDGAIQYDSEIDILRNKFPKD